MSIFTTLTEIIPFTAPDGARVQQIAGSQRGHDKPQPGSHQPSARH